MDTSLDVISVLSRPQYMDCNLPCPVDTVSQQCSQQIAGNNGLPVYPPLTLTINYDQKCQDIKEEKPVEKSPEKRNPTLLHNILHLPGAIADTLLQKEHNY
ncbi:unnamed protein product [Leptosia nina]|uniref:Uncharacterized protein n=1 Tax=Leptosia nina TaxID=320188 RepID=A0AAV1JHH1_9NEOP